MPKELKVYTLYKTKTKQKIIMIRISFTITAASAKSSISSQGKEVNLLSAEHLTLCK